MTPSRFSEVKIAVRLINGLILSCASNIAVAVIITNSCLPKNSQLLEDFLHDDVHELYDIFYGFIPLTLTSAFETDATLATKPLFLTKKL